LSFPEKTQFDESCRPPDPRTLVPPLLTILPFEVSGTRNVSLLLSTLVLFFPTSLFSVPIVVSQKFLPCFANPLPYCSYWLARRRPPSILKFPVSLPYRTEKSLCFFKDCTIYIGLKRFFFVSFAYLRQFLSSSLHPGGPRALYVIPQGCSRSPHPPRSVRNRLFFSLQGKSDIPVSPCLASSPPTMFVVLLSSAPFFWRADACVRFPATTLMWSRD